MILTFEFDIYCENSFPKNRTVEIVEVNKVVKRRQFYIEIDKEIMYKSIISMLLWEVHFLQEEHFQKEVLV
jgi:hypothetical protein